MTLEIFFCSHKQRNELAFIRVLKLITFMVGQIITFMVKILLHLWLVSNLLHLWWIFITPMVGITFMVSIAWINNSRAKQLQRNEQKSVLQVHFYFFFFC